MKNSNQNINQDQPKPLLLFALLVFVIFIAGFYQLRFNFQWSEIDTAIATNNIRAIISQGTLETNTVAPYPNGFGYQAFAVVLSQITGISEVQFQQIMAPFLLVLLPIIAYITYRELTGSVLVAVLGVVILLVQPEFLFVTLRGTHEKLTRLFMFLTLFFLIRSYHTKRQTNLFFINILLFYLSAFILTSVNNLLANSFFVALFLTLVAGLILSRWQKAKRTPAEISGRLLIVILSCIIIVFIFTFYLYKPAQHDLLVMKNLFDRLSALLLGYNQASNVYSWVRIGWVNPLVYLFVSLANWLLILITVPVWFRQAFRWFKDKSIDVSMQNWLLWALFGAFAFQGALSILVDMSGFIASNLQHRLFPSFAMVAAPFAAQSILNKTSQIKSSKFLSFGVFTFVIILSILSVFKATNEPLLSNKWLFYQKAEIAGLDWAFNNLESRTIGAGFDERLHMAYLLEVGKPPNRNQFAYYRNPDSASNFLISDIIRVRSIRLARPLPNEGVALLTYDNGITQLYHKRPQTPYQK